MAEWLGFAESVANAVSSVSSTVANYGPNDQKKAVSAAEKAGKAAAKMEEKKYPSWDISGTKALAKSIGITTRAAWKQARAEAADAAYDAAYNEVWDIYIKAKEAQINSLNNMTAQQQTDLVLQQVYANEQLQNKGGVSGCLGVASLLFGTGAFLSWLLYYVSNL